MKFKIFLCGFLFAPSAFANCVDLSHKFEVSLTEVRMHQVGCEKFERQFFFEGQPAGAPDEVRLDGQWKNDAADDEYEAFTRQIRWSWNPTKTSLIYEYFISGNDKKSGDQYVTNGTQIYTPASNGVKVEEFIQKRVTKQDGSSEVSQTKTEDVRSSL
jgi:hypothetical protein